MATYYCAKCSCKHRIDSKVGKAHKDKKYETDKYLQWHISRLNGKIRADEKRIRFFIAEGNKTHAKKSFELMAYHRKEKKKLVRKLKARHKKEQENTNKIRYLEQKLRDLEKESDKLMFRTYPNDKKYKEMLKKSSEISDKKLKTRRELKKLTGVWY